MQTSPLAPEQAELIGELSDATQRLNRLNSSLLLLSNIENSNFVKKEENSVREITEETVKHFSDAALQKEISILCTVNPDIKIVANTSLLEILISNLISNAIRHSPQNGAMIISSDKHNTLSISNTAIQGPLDTEKIFERFHKQSQDAASIGLGLAIVSGICKLSGYKLNYSFKKDMHLFSIFFPV